MRRMYMSRMNGLQIFILGAAEILLDGYSFAWFVVTGRIRSKLGMWVRV